MWVVGDLLGGTVAVVDVGIKFLDCLFCFVESSLVFANEGSLIGSFEIGQGLSHTGFLGAFCFKQDETNFFLLFSGVICCATVALFATPGILTLAGSKPLTF